MSSLLSRRVLVLVLQTSESSLSLSEVSELAKVALQGLWSAARFESSQMSIEETEERKFSLRVNVDEAEIRLKEVRKRFEKASNVELVEVKMQEIPKEKGRKSQAEKASEAFEKDVLPRLEEMGFSERNLDSGLIDIGGCIADSSFDEDLEDVLSRSYASFVRTIIITGTTVKDSHRALEICRSKIYSVSGMRLFCTAGIHPLYAPKFSQASFEEIEKICQAPEVKAIGECGLDFHPKFGTADIPNQKMWFEKQVELAQRLRKPLFLHERNAVPEFLQILDGMFSKNGKVDVCVHCYSSPDINELKEYISRGYFIGITGFIAQKRGQEILKLLREIPLSRLMVETDAPYLTPDSYSGLKTFKRRNEPCMLPFVIHAISNQLELPAHQVAHTTALNAARFFHLDSPPPLSD